MSAEIRPTPDGQERLSETKNLYLSLRPEDTDFDFATGIVYIFGIGNFMASQIDPRSGEYIYDEEAAQSIRENRALIIHPKNAQEGDLIFIQMSDRTPDGSQRQASMFFRFHEFDWEPITGVDSRVIDLRPADQAQRLRDYFQRLQAS